MSVWPGLAGAACPTFQHHWTPNRLFMYHCFLLSPNNPAFCLLWPLAADPREGAGGTGRDLMGGVRLGVHLNPSATALYSSLILSSSTSSFLLLEVMGINDSQGREWPWWLQKGKHLFLEPSFFSSLFPPAGVWALQHGLVAEGWLGW